MNKHIGSDFDNFLENEQLLDESEAVAIKRVIAWELEQFLNEKNITKTQLAKKMHTSRAALERLLSPINTSITLNTLVKAAHVLGKRIHFSFI